MEHTCSRSQVHRQPARAMKGWREKLSKVGCRRSPTRIYEHQGQRQARSTRAESGNKSLVIKAFIKYLEPGESAASIMKLMEQMGVRPRRRPWQARSINAR
jgi:hypothetical protein